MKTSLSFKLLALLISCNMSGLSIAMEAPTTPPYETQEPAQKKIKSESTTAFDAQGNPVNVQSNSADHTFEVISYKNYLQNHKDLNTFFPQDVLKKIFSYLGIAHFQSIPDVCREWRRVAEANFFILPRDSQAMHAFMTANVSNPEFTQRLTYMVARDKSGFRKLENYWTLYFKMPLNERLYGLYLSEKGYITLFLNESLRTPVKNRDELIAFLSNHSGKCAHYFMALAVYSCFYNGMPTIIPKFDKSTRDAYSEIEGNSDYYELKQYMEQAILFPVSLQKSKDPSWDDDTYNLFLMELYNDPECFPIVSSALVQLDQGLNSKQYHACKKEFIRLLAYRFSQTDIEDLVSHPLIGHYLQEARNIYDLEQEHNRSCSKKDHSNCKVGKYRSFDKAIEMKGNQAPIEELSQAAFDRGEDAADSKNYEEKAVNLAKAFHYSERAGQKLGDKILPQQLFYIARYATLAAWSFEDKTKRAEYFAHAFRYYDTAAKKLGDKVTAKQLMNAGNAAYYAFENNTDPAQKAEYCFPAFQYCVSTIGRFNDQVIPEEFQKAGQVAKWAANYSTDPAQKAEYYAHAFRYYDAMIMKAGVEVTSKQLKEAANAAVEAAQQSTDPAQKAEYYAYCFRYFDTMIMKLSLEEKSKQLKEAVKAAVGAAHQSTDPAHIAEYYAHAFRYYDTAIKINGGKSTINQFNYAARIAFAVAKYSTDSGHKAEYFAHAFRYYDTATKKLGDKVITRLLLGTADVAYNVAKYSTDPAYKAEYFAHAFRYFDRAIKILGDKATSLDHRRLGETAFCCGHFDKAFEHFEKAKKLEPDDQKRIREFILSEANNITDPTTKEFFIKKANEYQIADAAV